MRACTFPCAGVTRGWPPVGTDKNSGADPRTHSDGGFYCEVTGFEGFEQEILRLRNANREHPETLEYLRWRYQVLPDAPPTRVFWLLTPDGERIGMGSAVFRPYWLERARTQIAVLGDISLDVPWRGRGLGLRLMRFMTGWLDEHFPGRAAFVIPTEAAQRSLTAAGWVTLGELVPHVYLLDTTRYVRALVRSGWLAAHIARPLRGIARLLARRHVPRGGVLRVTDNLEQSLLEFAAATPTAGGAVHDIGPETLRWRYAQHPHTRFSFATFSRAGQVRGLLVFAEDTLDQSYSIYDFAALSTADLRAMLALCILRGLAKPECNALRIQLGEHHPDAACFRGVGFIARHADTVFQVHSSDGTAERLVWHVTPGDKDT
jgi:hypothetical protein